MRGARFFTLDYMDYEGCSCDMKPKVTIGLCARNAEDYVKEAINSIRDQDFPHELMELIFVDDGSEDSTLSIIQECISKIDIPAEVFHTSWKGLGHARNIIVTNAEGDFIIWVDADMVISRDFVTNLVNFIEQHPEVGIAKGRHTLEPGGNLLGTLEAYSRAAGGMVDYQSEKARSKVLGTGGSIYRAEAIEQVGGFDQNLRGHGEDLDIELRVRAAGWSLHVVDTDFSDYEKYGLTWRNLWCRYWVRGYHLCHFFHKNKGLLKHYRMFPPAAFLSGLLQAHRLFKLTHNRAVFALPFQCMFKMTAWYFGFIRSRLNSCRPKA
jgi:glycosyltransferase involved in cell wall biosynthesis